MGTRMDDPYSEPKAILADAQFRRPGWAVRIGLWPYDL